MSYEKFIGFDHTNMHLVHRLGITPIRHKIKDLLPPKQNKEPEPKILVPRPSDFGKFRTFITQSRNAFLIPDQTHSKKDPLVSVLLDTKENGHPTAEFAQGNHSLRYRFEIQTPEYDEDVPKEERIKFIVTNRDYNEKELNKAAEQIGGCIDRDEREYEMLRPEETLFSGYEDFKQKYRDLGDPTYCDQKGIAYKQLHVLGGYTAARTEIGFAVQLPESDLLFVFEGCEDIFETYAHDMAQILGKLCEIEFEPKEVWGTIPAGVNSPEKFKAFLYSCMTQIRNQIHAALPGSNINLNSKADFVKQHLADAYGNEDEIARHYGLTAGFNGAGQGRYPLHTAEQFSLNLGQRLQRVLNTSMHDIHQRAERLHREKIRLNEHFPVATMDAIGTGARIIDLNSHRSATAQKAVARLALTA